MAKTSRKNKDNIGVVYLLTNSCYEVENTYKFGYTIQPYSRRRTQMNSTPPTHPFINKIIMFSPHYKEIEKWLKQKFIDSDILLYGDGGTEWVQADFSIILKVYMDSLSQFSNTDLCYGGKRYKSVNGDIQQYRLPKCRLDLLRILDGFKIKCIKNNKKYVVRNNKIEVNGSLMTLSRFISHNYPRSGKTNKHNGYMYFTFKGELIYDMWQNLVRTK